MDINFHSILSAIIHPIYTAHDKYNMQINGAGSKLIYNATQIHEHGIIYWLQVHSITLTHSWMLLTVMYEFSTRSRFLIENIVSATKTKF